MATAVIAGVAAGLVTGSVAFGLGVAVVSFVASELLKPDMPNLDSLDKFSPTGHLNVTKDTAQPVPIIYGEAKVGGNIVYVGTTGDENEYLHIVQTISEGKISSLVELYLDDKKSSEFGDVVFYKFHDGRSNQDVDADLKSAISEWDDAMRHTAYLYVRVKYDREKFGSMPNITAVVKGMELYDFRDGNVKFSDNPVLCLYDFLTNRRYGVGIKENFIDFDSFKEAANWCDDKGYTFNGVIKERRAAIDVIHDMLMSFKCSIVFTNGKFKILPLQYDAPVMTIDKSKVVGGSFKKILPSVQDLPNTLRVKWMNPKNNYIYDDLIIYNSQQIQSDGERIEKNVILYGCNSVKQARSVGSYLLERMRFNTRYSFVTNNSVLPLEAGDMVVLDIDDVEISNEQVRVERIVPKTDGTFEVMCVEERPEFYNDKADLVAHTEYNVQLPDGLAKPVPPSGFSLSAGIEANEKGLYVAYIIATWVKSNDPRVIEYELRIRESGTLDFTYVRVGVDTTAYKFGGLKTNTMYYLSIRSIAENGIYSDWTNEVSITTPFDTQPPAKPTGLTLSVNFKTIYARWAENSEPDLAGYEVYAYQNEADFICASNILRWRGTANYCAFPVDSTGTWYVKVLAYDRDGNKSECSDYASIEVGEPILDSTPEGYNLLINSDFENGLDGWEFLNGCVADVVYATEPRDGAKAAQNTCTDKESRYSSKVLIPIQKDRAYILEGYLKHISGGAAQSAIGVEFYDKDGNYVDANYIVENPPDNFKYYYLVFGFNTDNPVPDSAVYMKAIFVLNYGADGVAQVQGVRIREVIESVWIKDAAITSAKIAKLAVDDAHINSVSGNKIHAGVITDIYGTESDYKFKIDLNEGYISIKNGVAASNILINGDFSQGTYGWEISNGEILENADTSLNFKNYLHLKISDGTDESAVNNGKLDLDTTTSVAIGGKFSIDTNYSIDEIVNLQINIHIYDSDMNWLGYRLVDELNKYDYTTWKDYLKNYTIDLSGLSNPKYARLEFMTTGSSGGFTSDEFCDNPNFYDGLTGWSVSDSSNIVIVNCSDVNPQYWACNNDGKNVRMLVDGTSREIIDADYIDVTAYRGKKASAVIDMYCENPSDSTAIQVGGKFYDSNHNYLSESVFYEVAPDEWTHYEAYQGTGNVPDNASYVKLFARAKAISGSSFYAYIGWMDLQFGSAANGYWNIAKTSMKPSYGGYSSTREVKITNGDVVFYKYKDDGSVEAYKSLRKIVSGYADSGDWVALSGFYDRQPEIILSPYSMKYYDAAHGSENQFVRIEAQNLNGDIDTGEWSFQPIAELVLESTTSNDTGVYGGSGGCELYFYDNKCSGKAAMVSLLSGASTAPERATSFRLDINFQIMAMCKYVQVNHGNHYDIFKTDVYLMIENGNGDSISGWIKVGEISAASGDGIYKNFRYVSNTYSCAEGDTIRVKLATVNPDLVIDHEYSELQFSLPDGACGTNVDKNHDDAVCPGVNYYFWADVNDSNVEYNLQASTQVIDSGTIYYIAIG